jgi:predicted RNA-binding protein YlqC (UPF0109 family)
MVEEFLSAYTKLLVENPDDISIEITEIEDGLDEIVIFANREDIGKLIGKKGRMINSIKTVISGCKARGANSCRVNIKPIE